MKKSKWWLWLLALIPALILTVLALRAAADPYLRTTERFERDRADLETAAQKVLARGSADEIKLPDGWTVRYFDSGVQVVEFEFGSWGMGSSTSYWGLNYVPSDEPVGFQGISMDHWKREGTGRLWCEPEGDNRCYVERLASCWYYYKMDF